MIIDPLQQALDQLRALSQPQAPVGQPQVPAVPRLNGPDFTGQYTSLPSADEREQILAKDGTADLFAPPSRDFSVPDPTPEPALSPEDAQRVKTAEFVNGLHMDTVPSPRTVEEGTSMVDEQLGRVARAKAAADAAKAAAAKAHAEGMAGAAEKGVEEQTKLMGSHQRTLDAINASADMENANWISNMSELAKQEPNPGRWWDNQSGLGKALWALSLVFGSGYAAITPGAKNAALQMVQEEINRDMQLQANRLKQQMAVEELRGSVLKDKHARNRSDEQDKYGQQLGRIMALQRAWEARSSVPTGLDDQAAIAESQAWFEAQKLPLFESRRGESVAARSAAAQRAHQTALQQLEIKAAKERQDAELNYRRVHDAIEDQRARDLAQLRVDVKGPRFDQKGRPVDENNIPLFRNPASGVGATKTSGAVAVDANGRPVNGDGVVNFRKEDGEAAKQFSETAEGANRRFRAMTRLNELLADQGRISAFVAGTTDPELTSLITQLGTEGAKADDPGGRYTNQDFSRGISGRLGFDPNGTILDRAKFADNIPEIRKNLSDQIQRMPTEVGGGLSKIVDWSINGDASNRVIWSPVDRNADKVQQRSQNEIEGLPDTNLRDNPVKSREDYDKRAAEERAEGAKRGQLLPPHDETIVDAAKALGRDADGKVARGPDSIAKQANALLKQLDSQLEAIKAKSSERPETTWDRYGEPRREMSEDDKKAIAKIEATKAIVETITNEDIQKATKKLKEIEGYVNVAKNFRSEEEQIEEIGRRFGLKGSPREIREIVKKGNVEKDTDYAKAFNDSFAPKD